MADNIGVTVAGDRAVSIKFDTFPTRAHDSLLARISSLTDSLAARVRGAIHSKTGKLRSTISEAVYDDQPKKISGRVFVDEDYAKAAAEEYGAHGKAQVSAHSASLDHVWSRKLASPTTVLVSAHSRRMNIAAQKFLRGSLAADSGDIQQQLRDAVEKSLGETS